MEVIIVGRLAEDKVAEGICRVNVKYLLLSQGPSRSRCQWSRRELYNRAIVSPIGYMVEQLLSELLLEPGDRRDGTDSSDNLALLLYRQ